MWNPLVKWDQLSQLNEPFVRMCTTWLLVLTFFVWTPGSNIPSKSTWWVLNHLDHRIIVFKFGQGFVLTGDARLNERSKVINRSLRVFIHVNWQPLFPGESGRANAWSRASELLSPCRTDWAQVFLLDVNRRLMRYFRFSTDVTVRHSICFSWMTSPLAQTCDSRKYTDLLRMSNFHPWRRLQSRRSEKRSCLLSDAVFPTWQCCQSPLVQ